MAIQPIDLQVMYTSLEKVSKNVAFQQQGAKLQSEMREDEKSKKIQEKHKSVQEAKKDGASATVKNNKKNAHQSPDSEKKYKKDDDKEDDSSEKKYETVKDPSLGQHIDILG